MGFPHKTPDQVPHFKTTHCYNVATEHGFQQFQFYKIVSCLLRLFSFIPDSINVALAIGNWAFGHTENNAMLCLSDR